MTAVDGHHAVLAPVNLPGPPRVGRYGADLEAFEQVALPALGVPGACGVPKRGTGCCEYDCGSRIRAGSIAGL